MRAIDIVHAEIGTVSSRVDGSVKFYVITPELDLQQRATVLGFHGKNARILMEPKDVSAEGIDEVETEAEPKTPSERLRAVLYVLWKQRKAETPYSETTFSDFYHQKMETFIERVKEKLK